MMKVLIFLVMLGVSCRGEGKISLDDRESAVAGQPEKTGEEYLRKVMNRLQSERTAGHAVQLSELMNLKNEDVVAETMEGDIDLEAGSTALQAEIIGDASVSEIPQGLTAEQLKSVYNHAAVKLANLSFWRTPVKPISHFHHPPPPPPSPTKNLVTEPVAHELAAGVLPGYYYYYYPIKSFIGQVEPKPSSPPTIHETAKPVQMQATVTMTDPSDKSVEPLFMAISSFIGMALVFIISVLFVPKFGRLRSGERNPPDNRHDLLVLGRLVFDSLEGKDCEKRLACEIGRILRGAKIDNKPLRVLEIILPSKFGNQISMIRRTAAKKEKCISIPCKLKKAETPKPEKEKKKLKRKPWKKAQSAHDLWMKQFENRTKFHQPENIWERNQPKNF